MRAAVYSGTRNLYPHMIPAVKSLIANSGVEKIYLLIEDDEFPEALPPLVETVNVSDFVRETFRADGPNMKSPFTYMAVVRACYATLFPDLDKILQLDVDTIVVDNIDSLWDIEMGSKWCLAAEEPFNNYFKPWGMQYYNVGVAMFNLKAIRQAGVEKEVIKDLNTVEERFAEQDAWQRIGAPRKFLTLENRFNDSKPCGYTDNPAVIHYAGWKNWWDDGSCPRREYYRKYRDMTWEEVFACRGETPEKPKAAPKKPRARKKTAES